MDGRGRQDASNCKTEIFAIPPPSHARISRFENLFVTLFTHLSRSSSLLRLLPISTRLFLYSGSPTVGEGMNCIMHGSSAVSVSRCGATAKSKEGEDWQDGPTAGDAALL